MNKLHFFQIIIYGNESMETILYHIQNESVHQKFDDIRIKGTTSTLWYRTSNLIYLIIFQIKLETLQIKSVKPTTIPEGMILLFIIYFFFCYFKIRITEVWITVTLEEIRKENISLSNETTSILKGRQKNMCLRLPSRVK